ncbi:rhodopsin-like [Saccostrea echinata]|uniref:rhodopsin-like n=1 Tax=Saccostrea echinata TaxID=191078 RepID=UPI002A7F8190|nr:rhodopsin-like [Saccostrea echinata]
MQHNTTLNVSNVSVEVAETPKYLIPVPLYYTIGTGLLFVVMIGPFMSITSLVVFAKNKHLQSPTNIFVISLLVGDAGMSCGAFISMTANFNRYYFWGDNVCTFEGFWLYLMGLTNLYTHAGIAYDRYIMIAKPLQANKITMRLAVVVVLVIWFQGFCWAAFPFFGWGKITYEPARTSCAVEWDSKELGSASYNIAITIWSLLIPLAVIFFSYYRVMMTIRHIARNSIWDMNSRVARKNLRTERKMFKTIAYMLASYIWSWTPYTVVSVWAIIGESRDIPTYIITIPAIVAKSSSIWDPLIYLWTNKQFRMSFYSTIPCADLGRTMIEREEKKNKQSENSDPEEPEVRQKEEQPKPKLQTQVVPIDNALSENGQQTDVCADIQVPVPSILKPGPSQPNDDR